MATVKCVLGHRGCPSNEWNDGVKDHIYCLGHISQAADGLFPECKACSDHVSKAQDDLEAFTGGIRMADNFDKVDDLVARLREATDSEDSKGAEGLIRVAKEAAEMLENQAYIILGVMHSVDKWLDGKELEQDEVNRADTMREKILRIIESRPEQIHARLVIDWLGDARCSNCGVEVNCTEPFCQHCGARLDEQEVKE